MTDTKNTFDESKHPRTGNGRFAETTHGKADTVDLAEPGNLNVKITSEMAAAINRAAGKRRTDGDRVLTGGTIKAFYWYPILRLRGSGPHITGRVVLGADGRAADVLAIQVHYSVDDHGYDQNHSLKLVDETADHEAAAAPFAAILGCQPATEPWPQPGRLN